MSEYCTISAPGSCTAAGFTSGCCNPQVSSNCHGVPPDCWCDAECYDYGNCCQDIKSISCFEAPGSCLSAGHTSCCPVEQDTCLGKPANCFCDQLCAINDNCCGDIDQLSDCDLPTLPTNSGGWKCTTCYITRGYRMGCQCVCLLSWSAPHPCCIGSLATERCMYTIITVCKGCTGT